MAAVPNRTGIIMVLKTASRRNRPMTEPPVAVTTILTQGAPEEMQGRTDGVGIGGWIVL